jgi:hypothetical protein
LIKKRRKKTEAYLSVQELFKFVNGGNHMAEINIGEIVDHLSPDLRKALAIALEEVGGEVLNDIYIDEHDLFRAFKRAISRKCRTWERVPDRFIRM